MNIAPGSKIVLEIVKNPTNEGARKTLVRLARKDPTVVRYHRKQQQKRPSWEEWRRGAMTWHHQMKSRAAVSITRGAKYNITATVDVLRDLASVERFVKIG